MTLDSGSLDAIARDAASTEQRWLTTEQLSVHLGGIKVATIKGWRNDDRGPPYVTLGRLVRYELAAVERWLAAGGDRRPEPTSPPRRRRSRSGGVPAPAAVAGRRA